MITDITQAQYRMLSYIDNLHKNKLTNKQKLAIEYIDIEKAKRKRTELKNRYKSDNSRIRLHDFYIKNRKVYDVSELSEKQIDREKPVWISNLPYDLASQVFAQDHPYKHAACFSYRIPITIRLNHDPIPGKREPVRRLAECSEECPAADFRPQASFASGKLFKC